MHRTTPLDRLPLILAAASAAMLLFAFASQVVFDLIPCKLCIWQRWPHVAVVIISLVAWGFWASRPQLGQALTAIAGLILLVGAGIALFHVGVEQQWWQGLEGCTAPPGEAQSLDALRQQLLATPIARCDEVAWSLFGLSMAAWNGLISLALAGLAFQAVRKQVERRRTL
ncbi:disulfide bond formation protein B [Oceanibacterium hippocampi]|uniref:Disulfide bond formation protein B n=1 Tax=Oceanibacterium hippocampi TaxID=745714 RepID=A0A1Y5RWF3_9PROT|nr:disulfide bond formation protein B [Oceanibacterium hippocampi]SLN26851.1 disulfide bond formation protein B [Oceanibacterium hippocampi]